jgi:hypothetical protein
MPLSARVLGKEPSSAEIARFVSRTTRKCGRPAHFVSDRGACFTGKVFRRRGLRLLRPLVAEDLMETIELSLVHYAHFRPHHALGGATPVEIYFGRTPAHLSAIPPPRGRPGEGPTDLPFRVDYLDGERLLPVLVRKAD